MFCASVLLASCAAILDDDKTPVHSGEVETSYIAINLMATDPDTRAEGATYQEGLAAERAVNSAYFFFFQNGQPFPVTVTNSAVTAPATTGANFLSATLTPNGQATPNVSDVNKAVLLLKNYKGEYPNQIIAVLNWIPTAGQSYTMDDLKAVVDIQNTKDSQKYFVMSNAVFADGAGQAVTATPLTLANIYTTEKDATDHPVNIYVERIAAKVTVTAPNDKTFDLKRTINASGSEVKAYAKLEHWELYNEFQQSYLLKQIKPADWTVDGLGFNWNDQAFYRSYWADTPNPDWENGNTFTWTAGCDFALSSNVNEGKYSPNTYVYCGENTTKDEANRTKVILKAKLVDAGGAALELARWYGAEYLGEDDLLTAVASTLKNTYYSKTTNGDETTYTSIAQTDLKSVVGGSEDVPNVSATEVYFQLSDAGAAKTWCEYSSTNGYVELSDATVLNAKLKAVPSAVLYKGGQTYYFFDIKHLGAAGKDAEYGIVRNHIYNINIDSIGGYGSPVYDGNSEIFTPEYPKEPTTEGSYVSAKVNILSWRMVSQGVDIQPNPTPTPGN